MRCFRRTWPGRRQSTKAHILAVSRQLYKCSKNNWSTQIPTHYENQNPDPQTADQEDPAAEVPPKKTATTNFIHPYRIHIISKPTETKPEGQQKNPVMIDLTTQARPSDTRTNAKSLPDDGPPDDGSDNSDHDHGGRGRDNRRKNHSEACGQTRQTSTKRRATKANCKEAWA